MSCQEHFLKEKFIAKQAWFSKLEKISDYLRGENFMSEENQEKKNKKISKMTLAEIDSAVKKAAEAMNGQTSLYIKHLNQRKEELLAKKS